jgi:hypothetical protein
MTDNEFSRRSFLAGGACAAPLMAVGAAAPPGGKRGGHAVEGNAENEETICGCTLLRRHAC